MKKLIALIPVLFVFYCVKAQSYTVPRGLPFSDTRYVNYKAPQGFVLFDSLIMFRNIGDTQMKPLFPALAYLQNFAGDSTFWVWDMVRWKKLTSGGGGGGSNNTNLGSAYRWLNETSQGIKTVNNGFGIGIDSLINGELTISTDTSQIPTRYTIDSLGDLIGAGTLTDITGTNNYGFEPIVTSPTADTRDIQVSTLLTLGSVPFIGTNGALRENNTKFFWDSTNARLAVGKNTPLTTLNVRGQSVFENNYTLNGDVFNDRMMQINDTITSDNGTADRFPRGLFSNVVTAGSTNINGSTSEIISVQGNLKLTANITSKEAIGVLGRAWGVGTNTTTLMEGVQGQITVGAGATQTTTQATGVEATLYHQGGTLTASNLYYFRSKDTNSALSPMTLNIDTATGLYIHNITAGGINYGIRQIGSSPINLYQSANNQYPNLPTYASGGYDVVVRNQSTNDLELTTITPGAGTVTSVGLAAPSIFTVTNSPVTSTGTLTLSSNNAQGDLIYGSASNTLSYLAKGTKYKWLSNAGTSQNPSWGEIDTVGVIDVAGYILSGNFADTTSAINAAIYDASQTAKKTVRFSTAASPYVVSTHYRNTSSGTNHKGIELVSNLTVIIDNGVTIYADTAWTATTSNAFFYPLFNGYGVSNVTINGSGGSILDGQNTTFGNYTTNPYTNPAGYVSDTSKRWSTSLIQFFYGNNNKVKNVYGKNAQLHGLLGMYTTNLYAENSTFFRNGGSGLNLLRASTGNFNYIVADSNASDQLRVDSCTLGDIIFNNCTGSNAQASASATAWFAGMYIAGASNVHANFCTFFNNSAYGYDNPSDSTYKNNDITNCFISYNGNGGAVVSGRLNMNNNVFKNNGKNVGGGHDTKSPSYDPAAIVVNNAPHLIITDNHAIDTATTTAFAQTYFIKSYNGTGYYYNSIVANNIIRGVADTAHAFGGSTGNLGTNNIAVNNLIFASNDAPILYGTANQVLQLQSNGTTKWGTVSASAALTNTYIGFGDASNLLTGSANLTYSGGDITSLNTGIGTGTTTPSLTVTNTTAASAGAQQYSPTIELIGQGWKTTATAASQTVKFALQTVPVQGSSNPSGQLNFLQSINNGAYSSIAGITNTGVIMAGSNSSSFTSSGFKGAFLSIGGAEPSLTSSFVLGKSGGASTSFNRFIEINGAAFGTASSGGIGINASVVSAQVAETGTTYTGVLGSMQTNSAINYSSSPTSMTGVKGQMDFNNAGTAVDFSLGIGTQGDILLGSAVTKTLTAAYSLYATLSNQGGGSGTVATYIGLQIDSANNSYYSTANYGVRQLGTNATNFFAGTTIAGWNGGINTGSQLQTTSFSTAYKATAVDYTATANDCIIEVTVTGKTVTLPTAVGCTGRKYVIKLTASGSGTVATTSSQNIDASTTYSLSAQYKYVEVVSNNVGWIIVSSN